MKIDRETKKVLSEGEMLKNLTEHEGWFIVRNKFINQIYDLQSVLNIKMENPEVAVVEMKARAMAVNMLVNLMREIEGDVERHIESAKTLKDETFVRHYGGSSA